MLKRLVDFECVILICCSRTSIQVSGVQVLNLYGYVNEDWNRLISRIVICHLMVIIMNSFVLSVGLILNWLFVFGTESFLAFG